MGPKKAKTRSGSSKESTPKDKYEDIAQLTDSSQIVAHVLGNKANLNTSGRRSAGLRVSLPNVSGSQDTNEEDDVESEVTDVEEKKEIRIAQATRAENKSSSKVSCKNKLVSNLSTEELEQQYSEWIKVCSKNKVNVKNAFKLQLIDYMQVIMDRKTGQSENLTLMSCTLDASAKIYSYRVDSVYADVVKFIRSYQSGGKNKAQDEDKNGTQESGDENCSDREDDSGNKKSKKKDKKRSKADRKTFVKDAESFARKEIKMCYYRPNLPRNQTYFLESSVLDEGHMLAPNRPLFVDFKPDPSRTSTFPIGSIWKGGVTPDNFEEKITGYTELKSKMFIADDDPEQNGLNSENAFTFDPSVNSIAEMKVFNEICDGQSEHGGDNGEQSEVDYDDCDLEPDGGDDLPEHGVSVQSNNASSKCSVSFTPVAMSRMLRSASSKGSDYSYFDESKLNFMPCATHWKIKPSKRPIDAVGRTPSQNRKGKTSYLDFISDEGITSSLAVMSSLSAREDSTFTHKLSIKTTKDWFQKKHELIFAPLIPNIRKQVLSLFKDPDVCILSGLKKQSEEEECDANETVVLNPLDFTTAASLDDDGDDNDGGGNYHPDEDWSEKMDQDPENIVKVSDEPVNSLEGVDQVRLDIPEENSFDSLVPLPNKVEKVVVKFAKAQKRIDIKKLKAAIWNLLDLENPVENKENEHGNVNETKKRKFVNFSEVYKELPKTISKEAAAELSFPIAFMALLHLANEKCLYIESNDQHSDCTVSLAIPP